MEEVRKPWNKYWGMNVKDMVHSYSDCSSFALRNSDHNPFMINKY